jgi:hypothetical protein
MKKLLASCSLLVISFLVTAQNPNPNFNSWNPYVNQGMVIPAPLLPVELNGTGVLSFNVGNTGSTPLHLQQGEELRLEITLSNGLPDNADPLLALGGSWLGFFNWSYDVATNTYTATQNQEIPGSEHGVITIAYRVTQNTEINDASNGFIVSLFPPSYAEGYNSEGDDVVSSYTFVASPYAVPLSKWSIYIGVFLIACFMVYKSRGLA